MENERLEYLLGLTHQSTVKMVSIFQGRCDKCEVGERIVISTDATNCQYDSIDLCFSCLTEIHLEFEKTRQFNIDYQNFLQKHNK